MQRENVKLALKVSIKSIVINIFLFIFKLICGLVIHSGSLISDAVHSLSDIFSTALVMLGIKISNEPSDDAHPYGHEKIETVVAFSLALILFYIGGAIAFDGIKKIIYPQNNISVNLILNTVGIFLALSSIFLKEWLYRFTIKCAKEINSKSMAADAWHHRTDSLSSVGSLIGVIGITIGFPLVDSIACLVISLFIFKAAYDIIKDAFNSLVDHACPEDIIMQIESIVYSEKDIVSLDSLKTRMFGSKYYLDIEITLHADLSVRIAHGIATDIHDKIENNISSIKHCMVHVNPTD